MKIPALTWMGQILLWLGCLGGALATVSRLEVSNAPWQTIPWGLYLTSLAVGTAGVVMLRRQRTVTRIASAAASGDLAALVETLTSASREVHELGKRLDDMTCEEVLVFIDDRCVPLFNEFADARLILSHRFGTRVYADVMTEFASGERYLNRAWSAAADGYVDEVKRSIAAAASFMSAAEKALPAA